MLTQGDKCDDEKKTKFLLAVGAIELRKLENDLNIVDKKMYSVVGAIEDYFDPVKMLHLKVISFIACLVIPKKKFLLFWCV